MQAKQDGSEFVEQGAIGVVHRGPEQSYQRMDRSPTYDDSRPGDCVAFDLADRLPMTLPTLNFLSFESRSRNPLALLFFTVFCAVHPLAAFAVLRYFFPATWQAQISLGVGAVILTTLFFNLLICFGEYMFHRYLLHANSLSFLGRLSFSHLAHHKLTNIKIPGDRVVSAYPITDHEHDHAATFPPYALLAFMGVLTPLLAVIAFSFPQAPVLIGGYTAIALAHYLYESMHVAHHTPFDPYWKTKIEQPLLGTMWRKMYGFHQAHHANYKCNMNIAGFFGVPLGDLMFGTYQQPEILLIDGAPATKAVAAKLTSTPNWPVSMFDNALLKRRKRMMREQDQRAERKESQPESAMLPGSVVDPAGPAELR